MTNILDVLNTLRNQLEEEIERARKAYEECEAVISRLGEWSNQVSQGILPPPPEIDAPKCASKALDRLNEEAVAPAQPIFSDEKPKKERKVREPVKPRVLAVLSKGWASVEEIQNQTGLATIQIKAAVKGVLKDAVEVRENGGQTQYRAKSA